MRPLGAAAVQKEWIMTQSRIVAVIALAIGAALLFFAWQGSAAPVDQVSEALTGRYTDATMWYLVGGIACVAGGVVLLLRGTSNG